MNPLWGDNYLWRKNGIFRHASAQFWLEHPTMDLIAQFFRSGAKPKIEVEFKDDMQDCLGALFQVTVRAYPEGYHWVEMISQSKFETTELADFVNWDGYGSGPRQW